MAAAVASPEHDDGQERSDKYSRFLIIGGGMAGIAAAGHLVSKGIRDFKLVEARNRLGGRIVTFQLSGTKAELGANWIHGVMGNPLYELAVSKGVLDPNSASSLPKAQNIAATTEDGKRVPFAVVQEVYEAYFWFFKRCEEYFLCKFRPPDGVKSVGQHIELEISIYLQRFPPPQRRLRRLVFDYLLRRECCICGCHDMAEVDLMSLGSYTELPGGNITLPKGYSSLLQVIVDTIPKANIHKGKPVRTVHWKYRPVMEEDQQRSRPPPPPLSSTSEPNDGGNESDSAESSCSVKTVRSAASKVKEDGEEPPPASSREGTEDSGNNSRMSSQASSICPTPRHMRQHPNVMVEFEDGDRLYTDHVICAVPLGCLKRNRSLFSPELPAPKYHAMSKLNFGTVNKIFLEYDRPFLSPIISEVILLWDHQLPDPAPGMEDRWFRKIYSFSKVSETLLLGWIAGEEAEYMETLKMSVVADTCTKILRNFLADPYVPQPKSCVFTAWHSQPYSMGSYSSVGLGGQQRDIEKVAEPLFQRPNHRTPVVAFAGEHCHPSFYSTVHGAYLSGRAAAQFFLSAEAAKALEEHEDVFNLGAASVADLSTWLEEISMGQKNLEDFKAKCKDSKTRPQRDAGNLTTPR